MICQKIKIKKDQLLILLNSIFLRFIVYNSVGRVLSIDKHRKKINVMQDRKPQKEMIGAVKTAKLI